MLTKRQIENLKKGRDFLRTKVTDEQFNMRQYNFKIVDGFTREVNNTVRNRHTCGSLGCAMGWMVEEPSLLRKILRKDKYMSYNNASEHLFGLSSLTTEWDFLFSIDYEKHDNTRAGAIGRINTLIKYPDLFVGEVGEQETYREIPF